MMLIKYFIMNDVSDIFYAKTLHAKWFFAKCAAYVRQRINFLVYFFMRKAINFIHRIRGKRYVLPYVTSSHISIKF